MSTPEQPERGPIEALLARTALRGEAGLSIVRVVFCVAVVVRFVVIGAAVSDSNGFARAVLTITPISMAIAFSLAFLRQHARGDAGPRWLATFTVLDAVVCFLVLSTNVLWPGLAYRGIVVGPDIAAVLVITIAAGFRLSLRLAIAAGILNVIGVAALVALDQLLRRAPMEYGPSTAALWMILVMGAAGLAALSAWRTRTLALRGARESLRSERMRHAVEGLLHGHHDAHSLVSSLSLTAVLLERGVDDDPELSGLASHLRGDLEILRGCLRQVRESAEGEVAVGFEPSVLDLPHEVKQALEHAARSLEGLAVDAVVPGGALRVGIAGGRAGLARVLWNLLSNAHKGDGRRGARRVLVTVERRGNEARIIVDDDGPGWSEHHPPGVGLSSVERIVQGSGGRLRREESPSGGARVSIALPVEGQPSLDG